MWQFDSKQAEKGNTSLKPLKPTGEHHGKRGEDHGPEVVPGQQHQQQPPAWLNSSSIKVCFPEGERTFIRVGNSGSVLSVQWHHRAPYWRHPEALHVPHKAILCHVHKAMSKKGSTRKSSLVHLESLNTSQNNLVSWWTQSNELKGFYKEVCKIKFLLYTGSSQISQLMNQQY